MGLPQMGVPDGFKEQPFLSSSPISAGPKLHLGDMKASKKEFSLGYPWIGF